MSRARSFALLLIACAACAAARESSPSEERPPNVILLMADDLGWGDVGFNGGIDIATPHLDQLAANGLVFERFYAAAPVCSPTRGSCLTGRHPSRYGIAGANSGHLPAEEITLQEVLRERGYVTGHFGKWHLGTLTKTLVESNRGGPRGARHYAPPWEHGFDVAFSTEAKVPTFDPMKKPGSDEPYGTHYWTGPDELVTGGLDGDDSRIIMDRVVPFVRRAVADERPFLAVIWLHSPHLPVVASATHLALYPEGDERTRHYRGTVTAFDEQVGRLRAELRALDVERDTMLWFCSDNGPEGNSKAPGSAGPFRGRKRALYEGGVRVPAAVEWPGVVEPGRSRMPVVTSDYLPTILSLLDLERPLERVLDGVDVSPIWTDARELRDRGIGFQKAKRATWVEDRFKLVVSLEEGRAQAFELYDLVADPGEATDLAGEAPAIVKRMAASLEAWRTSCASSAAGGDY